MLSIVNDYVEKEDITIPDYYWRIEIESWEEVRAPYLDQVKDYYQQLTQTSVDVIKDEHFSLLGLSGIQNFDDFSDFVKRDYTQEKISLAFYDKLMPYLLAFHGETAQVILNDDEYAKYEKEYLEQIHAFSDEAGLSFEEYVQEHLGLRGEFVKHLKERAYEDFVFKLIANNRYGHLLEEVSVVDYEAYIQEQVIKFGLDEIDVRENLSYSQFCKVLPEMMYNQELFSYFTPNFKIIELTND